MIYLAAPFSSPLPTVQAERLQKTVAFTGIMLKQGYPIFSPTAYTNMFIMPFSLPPEYAAWHQFDMQFLRKSEALWVLRLIGWEQTKEVTIARNIAKQLGIPSIHFNDNFEPLNSGMPIDEPPKPANK